MLTMRTLGEILPWPLVVFGAGRYAAADAASWHRGSRRPVTQEERRILALGGGCGCLDAEPQARIYKKRKKRGPSREERGRNKRTAEACGGTGKDIQKLTS